MMLRAEPKLAKNNYLTQNLHYITVKMSCRKKATSLVLYLGDPILEFVNRLLIGEPQSLVVTDHLTEL